MNEQINWVPLPRKRPKKVKLPDALERAERLIDWYRANKPDIARIAVSESYYRSFEEGVGTYGIRLTSAGLVWRDFLLYVAPT